MSDIPPLGSIQIESETESVGLSPGDVALVICAGEKPGELSIKLVHYPHVHGEEDTLHEVGSDSPFGVAMMLSGVLKVPGAMDAAMEVIQAHFEKFQGEAS